MTDSLIGWFLHNNRLDTNSDERNNDANMIRTQFTAYAEDQPREQCTVERGKCQDEDKNDNHNGSGDNDSDSNRHDAHHGKVIREQCSTSIHLLIISVDARQQRGTEQE